MTVDSEMVTRQCWCGSLVFKIQATFDEDYEIATYSLEMYCADCGSKHRTPTPLDKPDDVV